MSLIAKDLALKVLGGLAVGGTVIGGGIAISRYNKEDPELKELREKGLDCGDDYCTLAENKTLTVKHESKTKELTAIPKEAEGKIRIHKSKEGDKSKFSFSIEGGNITPTWASGSETSITKLEEFETYEIEEETAGKGENQQKKYFFKRKTKAADEIKKLLGLAESGCTFSADSTQGTTCTLDVAKLKAINFEGKKGEPTITDSGNTTLTITGISNADNLKESGYPYGYKFSLSGDKLVTIPASPRNITKKANGTVEFKIKKEKGKGLVLEKVSKVENMAEKLRLTDCKEEGSAKTCKLPKTINVYKSATESVKEATITTPANATITFEEDVADHEGGVKFTVAAAIAISGGEKKGSAAIENIEATSYEIKEQTVDGKKD